jgi:hypothetical protein
MNHLLPRRLAVIRRGRIVGTTVRLHDVTRIECPFTIPVVVVVVIVVSLLDLVFVVVPILDRQIVEGCECDLHRPSPRIIDVVLSSVVCIVAFATRHSPDGVRAIRRPTIVEWVEYNATMTMTTGEGVGGGRGEGGGGPRLDDDD